MSVETSIEKNRPLFPILWGAAAFALLGLWIFEPRSTAHLALFQPPAAPVVAGTAAPQFETFTVASYADGTAHSPSVEAYPGGDLQVVWFRGEREADRTVRLETSRFSGGAWSAPAEILSARGETGSRDAFVNTIGNPVLYRHPSGDTWLFYVTPKLGGWSTSQISLRRSTDDGKSWGPARFLRASPFFNMSSLVRFAPLPMEDGLVGLPAYFELERKFSEIIVINAAGQVVDKRRIGAGIQPELVSEPDRVSAFLRPMGRMQRRVYTSESADGGLAWSEPAPTEWLNPSAPICAAHFADGSLIMAYNDDENLRSNLTFRYRPARQLEWRKLDYIVRSGVPQDSISYCDMAVGPDQVLTVVFSQFSDRSIRGIRANQAWIAAQLGTAGGP